MMLKENVLVGSYYSYIQYTYFLLSSYHSALLSLLSEREGKCVAGKVGGRITTRDWEETGEEEGKCQKIETEGKLME